MPQHITRRSGERLGRWPSAEAALTRSRRSGGQESVAQFTELFYTLHFVGHTAQLQRSDLRQVNYLVSFAMPEMPGMAAALAFGKYSASQASSAATSHRGKQRSENSTELEKDPLMPGSSNSPSYRYRPEDSVD